MKNYKKKDLVSLTLTGTPTKIIVEEPVKNNDRLLTVRHKNIEAQTENKKWKIILSQKKRKRERGGKEPDSLLHHCASIPRKKEVISADIRKIIPRGGYLKPDEVKGKNNRDQSCTFNYIY